MYLIEKFVNVEPGEPYLLLPYGTITKNGRKREFTRAMAESFRLPDFKPPIKLGSHGEETIAGGHIIGLEVRDDGLYAVPEFNERGTSALREGNYRYHSPEVIWEEGAVEQNTGPNTTPLIWGDALLHTPHLGESTALYTVEPIVESHKETITMTQEIDMVSVSAFEKIANLFKTNSTHDPDPTPDPQPAAPSEDYAAKLEAATSQAEQYKAELAKLQAEHKKGERIAFFASEFKESPAVADDKELHELLADMEEDTAKQLVTKFKALSAQINESNLTEDMGAQSNGEGVNQALVFDAAVRKYMKDNDVNYNAAVQAVAQAQPELAEGAL